MTGKPAPFIWHDLMTPDLETAARFYSTVIGWAIEDSGMPGMSYSIIRSGGADVGGMMGMVEDGPPPMWTGYVYSPDVDADAKRAVSLGGAVCKEAEDIPGAGRFAVIADPGGAVFNLFKPASAEPPREKTSMTAGHVAWNSLGAGDGEREWEFYRQMFGWTETEKHEVGPGMIYRMFATGKDPVGGMMTRPPEVPRTSWTFYFAVDGIGAAAARVRKAGGQVTMEPMQVPGGEWIIAAADPHGAEFGLVSKAR